MFEFKKCIRFCLIVVGMVVPLTTLAANSPMATTGEENNLCVSLCDLKANASCKLAPPKNRCISDCKAYVIESSTCREKFDMYLKKLTEQTWTCSRGYPAISGSPLSEAAEFFRCDANTTGTKPKPIPSRSICGVSSFDSYCDAGLAAECAGPSRACGINADCRKIEACVFACDNSNGEEEQKNRKHKCIKGCEDRLSEREARL